jgi:N-acyl homoserine lactone hydrolase
LRRIIATVTPVLVADLLAEGERMPLYVHVIDHTV